MDTTERLSFSLSKGNNINELIYKAETNLTLSRSQVRDNSSLVAQSVQNLPAMQQTPLRFLGQEDPLEKE